MEIWETPPGLGLCPLQYAFTVCSQMHQWLALMSDNVVVSAAGAAELWGVGRAGGASSSQG